MRLTVQTDLTGVITRQELADMWSQASIPPIEKTDLDPAFANIFVGTNFSDVGASVPNPQPGQLFWHQQQAIMYVYTDSLDVMDNGDKTGVSLWLAVGPDSFETACLTAEPVPAGAVVEPAWDRYVKVFNPDGAQFGANPLANAPAPLGINQSGINDDYDPRLEYDTTAESGTWIRVCIDGYGRFWHPHAELLGGDPDSAISAGRFEIDIVTTQFNYVGCPPGDSAYRGAGIGNGNGATAAGPYTVGKTMHNVTIPSGYTATYPFMSWEGYGCVRFRSDVV